MTYRWLARYRRDPHESALVTLHLNPGITLVCFHPFPGFNCIVTALTIPESCTQNPDEVLVKFVRDISTKVTLSFSPSIGFGPGFEYKPLDEFRDFKCCKTVLQNIFGI